MTGTAGVLSELRVRNLGIIEEVHLVLGPAMTAITGETGAGKTLLVDALELIVGGRADPGAVREGAVEASVEGRFVVGDDEVVLVRVVPAAGRSRAYVNGRLATAGELAEHGRLLVDLHGQHDHQSLLAPATQRLLLDRFAGEGAAAARERLGREFDRCRQAEQQLLALGGDEHARAREIELLDYQMDEIASAGIADAEEDERLAAEEHLLANVESYRAGLVDARRHLDGAVADGLGSAVASLAAGDGERGELLERVQAVQAECAELVRDLRLAIDGVAADPERLDVVGSRRRLLAELRRKYGAGLADVLAYEAELRRRRSELSEAGERGARAAAERERARAEVEAAAAELATCRREAAGPLGEQVTAELRTLGLPAAVMTVAVEAAPAGVGADGADDVTFLLAPNPGEPARPLARAASGGELSRAMLALRVVLSVAPPTLVFDEVDAGIGGEAGLAVGRALARLGGENQVLVVTHLAQVAAAADSQVVVDKEVAAGRTVARAAPVVGEARVAELSRMLAGAGESDHARQHARELLAALEADLTRVGLR